MKGLESFVHSCGRSQAPPHAGAHWGALGWLQRDEAGSTSWCTFPCSLSACALGRHMALHLLLWPPPGWAEGSGPSGVGGSLNGAGTLSAAHCYIQVPNVGTAHFWKCCICPLQLRGPPCLYLPLSSEQTRLSLFESLSHTLHKYGFITNGSFISLDVSPGLWFREWTLKTKRMCFLYPFSFLVRQVGLFGRVMVLSSHGTVSCPVRLRHFFCSRANEAVLPRHPANRFKGTYGLSVPVVLD